ncbi:MAG: rod shape-determining protein MreC [Ruminococcaceae bacterium]|nr:rod shape-determining protein MreC [Oscillospiraceae bacterium]
MKKFLKDYGLWILFATAVIAVALAVMSFFASTSSPLVNLAGVLSSPFRNAYSALANWATEQQAYFADNQALLEENQALRNQIAEMEREMRLAKDDSEENARLRKLLELREKRRDFQFEAANITQQSSSNWISSLTLNRGTLHGVAVNNCVVTEEGFLAGIVTEVGLNWCTVLTVLDTDTSLGALVFRSGDVAVAQGDFVLMNEGRLSLTYLPADCELLIGDLVVTSGLGGYYPADLVIGKVESLQLDDSGSTRFAVVKPSAQLDELKQVFIIKSFDIVT